MEQYADLNLVGYLFNDCHGGFSFSKAFVERLNEQLIAEGQKPIHRRSQQERTNPLAIKLFQEMGSKWSSGRVSKLRLRFFPEEFLGNIILNEYDGEETAVIDTNEVLAELLKKFKRKRETNPNLAYDDLCKLEANYKDTIKKLERFEEYLKNVYYKEEEDLEESEGEEADTA